MKLAPVPETPPSTFPSALAAMETALGQETIVLGALLKLRSCADEQDDEHLEDFAIHMIGNQVRG